MPDNTGDDVLRRLRGRRHRPLRQPACRPLPARGPRLGRRLGRRPAAPVAVSTPGRPGRARTPIVAANGVERRPGRVITPDVGGGFGAKIACYPEELLLGPLAKERRPAGALARDPQRVDDGARPRPGPGAVRHHRRHPRRQGHALPAARHPGLRRLRRDRHDPRPVHDPADVVGACTTSPTSSAAPPASSPTPRRSSPTAAPVDPRRPRRPSGRWTCSPPRSAWTPPRCAART